MRYEEFGDITTAENGIIVHCCNAQGVQGAGVALTLREKWPEVYRVYRDKYLSSGLPLGSVSWALVSSTPSSFLLVANLIGQEFCGGPDTVWVDYEAIRTGLREIATTVRDNDPSTMIHYPKIGAGLAGGDWNIIQSIIDEELEDLEHTLWIYE